MTLNIQMPKKNKEKNKMKDEKKQKKRSKRKASNKNQTVYGKYIVKKGLRIKIFKIKYNEHN